MKQDEELPAVIDVRVQYEWGAEMGLSDAEAFQFERSVVCHCGRKTSWPDEYNKCKEICEGVRPKVLEWIATKETSGGGVVTQRAALIAESLGTGFVIITTAFGDGSPPGWYLVEFFSDWTPHGAVSEVRFETSAEAMVDSLGSVYEAYLVFLKAADEGLSGSGLSLIDDRAGA